MNANDIYNEGYYYYTGTNNYPLNHRKALEYFLKAAELGSSDAMNYIGLYFENGNLVEKDIRKAAEWYYKAFKANSQNPHAAYNLGRMYYNGSGVPKVSMDKAYQLFDCAIKLGRGNTHSVYAQSCYMKALIAMNEYHLYIEAGEYYLEAIRYRKMPEAFNNLGYLLEKGHISIKNSNMSSSLNALEYYEKAANMGFVPAMCSAARLYLATMGDKKSATIWLQRAIDAGYEPAKKLLKMVKVSESGSLLDLI